MASMVEDFDAGFDDEFISKIRSSSPLEILAEGYKGAMRLQSLPILAGYLSLVILSPVWIRFIPPLGLRKPMIAYNFLCVILSAYSALYIAIPIGANWPQSLFEHENVDQLVKHALLVYWVTKGIELLDTVFMVLRHKTRQISFLHVYHHGMMILFGEFGYVKGPFTGTSMILGINSLVHVFMYYYYGLTALSPGQRPMWKKALTCLQLAQFYIGVVQGVIGYMYYGFCIYGTLFLITLIILFSNFYYKAYVKAPAGKATSEMDKKGQ